MPLPFARTAPQARPTFSRDFAGLKTLDHGVGPSITFTRGSDATYFNAAGTLTTATTNEPRFDHNPSTGASLGLLIEESRTNSIRNSQAGGAVVGVSGTMPTNWVASTTSNGLTREIVAAGAVNGLAYVDIRWSGTTTAASGTQVHFESPTQIAATAGDTWTGSAYAQLVSGSLSGISLAIQNWYHDNAGTFIGFNQTSFTPTSSLVRVSHTGAVSATATRIRNNIQFFYASGVTVDFTLRIAAPQLEQGAFATSYIPTTNAAATRAADSAVVTPISGFYNQSEGTLFAEGSAGPTVSFGPLLAFNNQTVAERIRIRRDSSLGTCQFGVRSNDTTQADMITGNGTWSSGAVIKGAMSYKTNDFAASFNGASALTDTSGTTPTVTHMEVGLETLTGRANGHIRKVAYWPRRLSNALLQQLTA